MSAQFVNRRVVSMISKPRPRPRCWRWLIIPLWTFEMGMAPDGEQEAEWWYQNQGILMEIHTWEDERQQESGQWRTRGLLIKRRSYSNKVRWSDALSTKNRVYSHSSWSDVYNHVSKLCVYSCSIVYDRWLWVVWYQSMSLIDVHGLAMIWNARCVPESHPPSLQPTLWLHDYVVTLLSTSLAS